MSNDTKHSAQKTYDTLRKRRLIEAPSYVERDYDRINDEIAIAELRETLSNGGMRGFRF